MSSKEASVPFLQDVEKESCEEVRESKSLTESVKSYQERTVQWRSLLYFIPLIFLTNFVTFYFTNQSLAKNSDNLCALHTSQSWCMPLSNDFYRRLLTQTSQPQYSEMWTLHTLLIRLMELSSKIQFIDRILARV